MDLGKYLEKTKMTAFDFAVKAGIAPTTIGKVINKRADLLLSLAVRIHRASDRKVNFEEMITEELVERRLTKKKRQAKGPKEEKAKKRQVKQK